MDLQTGQALAIKMIEKGLKHIDYDYTVKLADTYKKIITGKDQESLLIQFVQREDAVLFAQRVKMTQSITGAVANKIKKPFYKVTRNKKVVRNTGVEDESKRKIVDEMLKGFFGSPLKSNSGLDGFMQSRFVDLSFTDPNAWLVIEWTNPGPSEIIKPKPFIVPSMEALNYEEKNDVVEWLLVGQPITFLRKMVITQGASIQDSTETVKGTKYTLYDRLYTHTFTEVDEAFAKEKMQLAANEQIIKIGNNRAFIQAFYEPKLGFAPAFRIGYARDEQTDSRTFVNPLEPAMCYFKKSIKTVSELDLSMTLHAFPQKAQYVQKCPGKSREKRCDGGRAPDGNTCEACNGSGVKVHTSAQDVLLLPMPSTAPGKDDLADLSKLVAYFTPPVDIVKIQIDYTDALEVKAINAVFNSQSFVQPTISKTATEQNLNMESVYDTLSPFAEKFSELWREVVSVFVVLAGLKIEAVNILHAFPADLKLKTVAMLLGEMQAINDSDAPTFLRDEISNDIAEALYADDALALKKYAVKRRFYPFNGRSGEDIQLATISEYVTKFDKVLYFNFEKIFVEIEKDDNLFWFKDYNKQWEIVGKKVNTIIGELDKLNVQRFTVGDLTGVNNSQAGQQNSDAAPGTNGE